MSMLKRFQKAASDVGKQAQAAGTILASQLDEGGKQIQGGFTLEKECSRAAETLSSFLANPEHPQSALNSIPKAVLRKAKGLAVFTIAKAGFVWSGKAGSGLIIARLPDGSWSAPSCIFTGGVGFGFQIGADISEFVVVLNSEEAVRTFARGGNLTIGGSLGASAGPVGTGGSIDAVLAKGSTPLFTYSKSKGLYAGVSLEGTALLERKDTNAAFYGQRIPAGDLLSGKVPAPEAASALYTVVESAESIDETALPENSFVPEGAPLMSPGGTTQAERPIFDADTDQKS